MRNAVQDHSQCESGKGQQDEDKVSRLLAGKLQGVEAALLDGIDLVEGFLEMTGISGIEEFSAGGGDGVGDLL